MSDAILVTGATGNAGKEVARQLAAKGVSVRTGVRNVGKAAGLLPAGAEPVLLDYDAPNTFDAALNGCNRAFLVAPSGSVHSDALLNPLIDKARDRGLEHIVLLSAMGIPYAEGAPLYKVERHLEASGIAYTFLRPNWFMQNFTSFMLPAIREQGGIFLPAGDAKTSFIDTRDIAAAAVAAFTRPEHRGRGYTLTGGEALDYSQAAAILSEVAGRDIRYYAISDDEFVKGAIAAGLPEENAGMMLALYQNVRKGNAAVIADDLTNLLGREAITFRQFAQDNAEAWR